MFVGATPTVFFGFQFVVAAIELAVLLSFSYSLLPNVANAQTLPWNWAPLKPVLKFSMSIAFTSSVWVLVTQTDKLVLSKLMPLAEYGYFTLAVLVASGVNAISSPIGGAIMPRMAKLEAEGDHAGLILVYRQSTQMAAVLAGAASITLAFWAKPLLSAWIGDEALARQVAPVLILYALGNGVLAIAGFPYYLQYAKGDLRLHLIGNAVFVVLLIPAIIWAANYYGGVGAGCVWLGMNLLSFVAWLPLVHKKFEPGLNLKWYGEDILPIFVAGLVVGYGSTHLMPSTDNRWAQLGEVVLTGIVVGLAGVLASSTIRARAYRWLAVHRLGRES
jgi:O-antigen/teichoic acid export membrane protein